MSIVYLACLFWKLWKYADLSHYKFFIKSIQTVVLYFSSIFCVGAWKV